MTSARTASPPRCRHCSLVLEDAGEDFCCHGCALAWRIVHEAGLEAYYTEREQPAPRPGGAPRGWSAVPVTACDDGSMEVRLQVDGLRCASCTWLVEHVLERTDGVVQATVSYATGRSSIRWDPTLIDLGAIAQRIAQLGYAPRPLGVEATPDRALLARLGVAGFAATWLMLASEAQYANHWFTVDPAWARLFQWLALALATPVVTWCAEPFLRGAISGLRRRTVSMDLPIALGITVLYVHGVVQFFRGGPSYLDSLGMLVALLLVGRLLESRGRRRAQEAATSLAAVVPRTARQAANGRIEVVDASSLLPGNLIDVAAGEEIAADGIVTEGAGQVRMALLTGESLPVAVAPGERVVAGTVLVDGALTVRVDAVGGATLIARMAEQLADAADRSGTGRETDRFARLFLVGTIAIAAATAATWALLGSPGKGLAAAVAVLIVACPCALALARPLAVSAGLGAAARRGILFRDADALLRVADVDVVALDKTGTLTEDALTVREADDATLRVAAGLERLSNHPIARAIVQAAAERGIPLPRATDVQEVPGQGISGVVDGRRWRIGQARHAADGARADAGIVVVVEGEPCGTACIRLGDTLRADAQLAVEALTREGAEVILLTGDRAAPALRASRATGIEKLEAGLDPEAKASRIRDLRAAGKRVLFAGDGVNDGLALAEADVGVAMGTGAASSVLMADAVIARPGVLPLVAARRASRATGSAIRFNLRWAMGYNALAVAAAAIGLVGPLACAILMPLSSALVTWGALRVEPMVKRMEDGR